jgi:hypothetical protein
MTINKLLALDVSNFVEKKNNLTYLSWAHAWAEALKADPAATFHVDTFQRADATTVPYMDINGTGMVWVRVKIFDKEITCFLPVMDHRNKPIQNPDAFQVNTAIMRCMTKCLALHGLGLHIYAGEDLPMAVNEAEEPKASTIETLAAKGAAFMDAFETALETKVEAPVSDRAIAQLFADGMVEFVNVCKSYEGLRSYWKTNQTQIDNLKSNHPDLFERVRDVFGVMKAKFLGEASE